MSSLKISDNVFLGSQELNKMINFISSGYKDCIKNIVKDFGIILDDSNSYFLVEKNSDQQIKINPGIAFDSDINKIILQSIEYVDVSPLEISSGVYYNQYVVLSYDSNHFEEGTVNIDAQGTLTGIGTKFLEILRGQYNFPVKIKFDSEYNTDEYSVIDVINDESAILSGDFYVENDLKYSIIGNFSPGFIPSDEEKFIYINDSFKIEFINSNVLPTLEYGKEFIIAILTFDANGYIDTISDERNNYIFNNKKQESNFVDNIVSVIKIDKIISTLKFVELFIEHGYKITGSYISIIDNASKLTINTGYCNYFGSVPPIFDNGFWDNWILLNPDNLKFCYVSESINNVLTLNQFDNQMLNQSGIYLLLPNFNQIEFEITLKDSSEVPEEYKIYKSFSIFNHINRFVLNMPKEENIVYLRYRLFNDNSNSTNWIVFNNSYYTDINSAQQSLQNSSVIINF